jgi:hypothetical protein
MAHRHTVDIGSLQRNASLGEEVPILKEGLSLTFSNAFLEEFFFKKNRFPPFWRSASVNVSCDFALIFRCWLVGWLTKQGGFIKNWKKRWFVLQGTKLHYYEDNVRSLDRALSW